MEQMQIETRWTKLQDEILTYHRELDLAIEKAENPRPGDNILREERLAEMKQKRLAEAVAVKMNSKERLTGQVQDFLTSLHAEAEARKYPLFNSTLPTNHRRSEYLDLKAKAVVESVGRDAGKIRAEIEANSEPEYESRLHYWIQTLNVYSGKPEEMTDYLPLLSAWRERLELPALERLTEKVKAFLLEVKRSYFLTAKYQNRKPKDFREYELRMEEMERADRKNGQSVGLIPNLG